MVRDLVAGLVLLSACVPLTASARAWPDDASSLDAPGQAVKGEPRQDPAKWFTDLDYPAEAKRAGAQGTVSVALDIDTSGHVAACRVTASSGSASLDQTTCWLVTRRGRFTVQTDASGAPQPYSYEMAKTWSLAAK